MELHPDIHYMVTQERRADAMRGAEQWRLIKSLRESGSSLGRPRRLRLGARHSVPIRPDGGARHPRPRRRQSASSPTV